MTAQHTSLTMTLGVSLPSLQPFFAHMPISNSKHTYQHIHIYMTSTDHGHDGRVLAQGHPMGLRPCRIRVAYYEGGGRDFWAGHYEGGGRGLSWEVVPAKTHCGSPMREIRGGSAAGILGCIPQLCSDANGTCGCMCWRTRTVHVRGQGLAWKGT